MEVYVLTRRDNQSIVERRELSLELLKDESIPWIHLAVENRNLFNDIEPNEILPQELFKRLQEPGRSFLVERIGNIKLLDCNVNYLFDNTSNHQLTFVFIPGQVITISTIGSLSDEHIDPDKIVESDRVYDANLIILILFRRLLDKNTSLANSFAKKVDSILKKSIARSFDTPLDEIEKLHASAIDLNELFEDQLTTIRLLPLNIDDQNVQVMGFFDRIEKSMEYVVSVTERSQDKLDYILQRYASVLQQKANARLNTLTIVQAIFVPLTFIAGVYGMNFVNMPELEWHFGYFYVWALMIFVGIGALLMFFRNGWFK